MCIKSYLLHLIKIHFIQLLVQPTEMYRASDIEGVFDIFHNQLLALFNKHFPKVKVKKRKYSNRKPWLSEALKNSIRYKNKLYRKSKRVKSAFYEEYY